MTPAPSNSSSACGGANISAVHDDIIGAHILSRLDGVSLSSFSCASAHFRSVVAADEQRLWRHISTSTWPSTSSPRVHHFISSFPGAHRGFFSGSFPTLTGHVSNRNSSSLLTEELISAVDIYYKNEPVFARVQETETWSGWFQHSPFRIDLLGSKESFRVGIGPVQNDGEKSLETELKQNLKLSWIVIDPARKKSVNVSSFGVVATERHWLTGEVKVKYSTVISVDRGQRAVEVEVKVAAVTCPGEMHVREVGMRVEDVEGNWLNGKDSLGILVNVMEFGERKIQREGIKGKERYGEYLEMKRVWREEKERRERTMEMACIIVLVGFCMLFFLLR